MWLSHMANADISCCSACNEMQHSSSTFSTEDLPCCLKHKILSYRLQGSKAACG
ncbi:hypothetical protein DUNSADRAFT_16647 [Dunaliella salina]|uniref:Encoded protein n=1 Tax=Dunaliella salina TaxID=3046 RepID=A0ABQ7G356_DUNSA|nr:hypothetical protein DUNSADRAFT_16647 [Dunaliella salina]|eukprot:KAF5829043.1 hypothetical protein DUNSADRAFT_16647 [Dunaliella salina]